MEPKRGIAGFVQTHTMITTHPDGRKEEGTEGEALIWISKHVQTKMHAMATVAGIETIMIDGSRVIFEKKQ